MTRIDTRDAGDSSSFALGVDPESGLATKLSALTQNQGVNIRVITHNIRYATNRPFKGEKPWPVRCPRLCSELVYNSMSPDATFICLQEVLHSQLMDIHSALDAAAEASSTWAYIGVGRDDGKKGGEYSPIFYRPSIWMLEDWHTVWFSETPERPSMGWDASCIRLVTIGIFRHREKSQEVVVMSTHLDDRGVISRAKSAKMILSLVEKYQISPNSSKSRSIVLAGDFNSPPDDEAYQIMTASGSSMVDVRSTVAESKRYGHKMTFTSFGEPGLTPSLIDFIFCNKTGAWTFKTFAVLENVFDDRVYLSDHRAVVTDLTLIG